MPKSAAKTTHRDTGTVIEMFVSLFLSLKAVLRKQRNVSPARTVRPKANNAFSRDKAVFISLIFLHRASIGVVWIRANGTV